MKVLSVFLLILLSFESISSLKIKQSQSKDFMLTCRNFSLFHWTTIQGNCRRRDGTWHNGNYFDVAVSSTNYDGDFRISYCLPKVSEINEMVWRLYCNWNKTKDPNGPIYKFEGDIYLGSFIENVDGYMKKYRDFTLNDFTNVVEKPDGERILHY